MSSTHIAAWAVYVPGSRADEFFGAADPALPTPPTDDAKIVLGRRGLLFKEPATRLALCAVQRALGVPDGSVPEAPPQGQRVGVVVSSNLGNLQTVCSLAERTAAISYRDVSPMDAPNASSNVIASSIAIRFGLRGPNITVCNGERSGVDAVLLADRLLRAGRADRVVVVGAEPADETAVALMKSRVPPGVVDAELREAAACVVLTRGTGPVRMLTTGEPAEVDLGFGRHRWEVGPCARLVDLTARIGATYGALGVLQTACAAAWAAQTAGTAAVCAGDELDGFSRLRLAGTTS